MTHTMTPAKWEEAYVKGLAHWTSSSAPSLFAKNFAVEVKDRKLTTVLEIGCGDCIDSIFFAKQGLKVTAVDVAPTAVALAQENVEKSGITVDVQLANAEFLQFPSGSFASVFSLSVLHATMLEKSLAEVYRVLRSGGFAFIHLYANTQTRTGVVGGELSVDNYIKLLKTIGFIIWDFYTEEEKQFDQAGEKHRIFVAFLGRG
ncbi:hypothetical protein LCGC14_2477970 [marine sediment metagenome]|uniref:Methyltransferase type 11 domain-containing protein n=1 Tax=marine sediment metagenome TaxID=412755 RepID=A0A0F9DKI7_9ZZZZ